MRARTGGGEAAARFCRCTKCAPVPRTARLQFFGGVTTARVYGLAAADPAVVLGRPAAALLGFTRGIAVREIAWHKTTPLKASFHPCRERPWTGFSPLA